MKFITYVAPAVAALAIASPAFSQASTREDRMFKAGYEYGYNYGLLVESCTMFMFGHVSEEYLARSARFVKNNEDLKPIFKTKIATNFAEMAEERDDTAKCNPTIQRVLRPTTQPSNGYRRTDNWY